MQRGSAGVPIAATVALAMLLRIVGLGAQSFDVDEAVTAGRVLHPGLGATLATLPDSERTPPLYYVIAWLWSRLFGTGEVALRSLSVLAGVLAVAAIALAARRLVGPRAGVAAGLLAAVSPELVFLSQEARAYALGIALTALAAWAFATMLRSPSRGATVAFTLAACAAAATHYFTLFVCVPMAGWLLWRRVRGAGAAIVALVLVALALVPLALAQATSKSAVRADFGQGSPARRLAVAVAEFVIGENPPAPSPAPIDAALRGGGVVIAILAGVLIVLALRGPRTRGPAALMFGIGLLGVLLPAAAVIVGIDFFSGRNVVFALVPITVAAAAGVSAREPVSAPGHERALLRRRGPIPRSALLAVALVVLVQLGVVVLDATEPGLQRPDWRAAAAGVGQDGRTGVVALSGGDDALLLYLHGRRADAGLVADRLVVIRGPDDDAALDDDIAPPGFQAVATRDVAGSTLLTLRSRRPRRVTRAELERQLDGVTALIEPGPR